ncbi:5S rRNA maturation endonuclease (ribonuclease M5) [Chryseobacterium sp. 16F]|uniref:5S rRNA maturation endonuclease (Ribonuclease M5) n=1 Tax=Frigoriflavimonas asaccharolytica TaxID=2735899 RepID=A0A8J8K4E0_9FLAO|nr:5S rRNA maturation endonuclease (ribonuclease M5) [Frigoriflavimonas asaccharolytica]
MKTRGDEVWFLNPFQQERTASFKVNVTYNSWFLFSEGSKGSVVDFLIRFLKTDIAGVISWANNQHNFSSFQQQKILENEIKTEKNYKILKVEDEISHPALIEYLIKRKVYNQRKFLKEIHYEVSNNRGDAKRFFSLAFPNNSENSYELSSSIWKGCLGKKDLTLIKNNSNTVIIFESFFDFLSKLELDEISNKVDQNFYDFLILNSVSNIDRALNFLENYSEHLIFCDLDDAGNIATKKILEKFPNAKDCREIYKNYKDLNENLMSKIGQ